METKRKAVFRLFLVLALGSTQCVLTTSGTDGGTDAGKVTQDAGGGGGGDDAGCSGVNVGGAACDGGQESDAGGVNVADGGTDTDGGVDTDGGHDGG